MQDREIRVLRYVTLDEVIPHGLMCGEDECTTVLEPGMVCGDVFEGLTGDGMEILLTVCVSHYLERTTG